MGGYLPCHVLVLDSGGVGEIWCALSGRAADGTHVRDRLRGILFAALESRFPDAVFEVRGTGHRVRLADGKWSGWARVSAGGLAGDALDVFGWDTGVARGVFCDGAVDDLGLGEVGERGEVADALFGFSADLDGCLVRHCSTSWYLRLLVPK